MSIKKSYTRIERYYYFCDYCKKKMDTAPSPEEPQNYTGTDFHMDGRFIHTEKVHIHVECLYKLLATNPKQ